MSAINAAGLWEIDHPPEVGYALVRHDSGRWTPGQEPCVEHRDLGLDGASRGAIAARHIRYAGGEPALPLHDPGFAFYLRFVLAGSVDVESDYGVVTLGRHDSICHPAGVRVRDAAFSPDFEAIEVTVPAATEPCPGASGDAQAAGSIVSRESDGYRAHAVRTFLQQRNLRVAELTDGRIDSLVAKPAGKVPDGGTGWHHHTMSEIFVVLSGRVEIAVDDRQPATFMEPLDAMSLGAGIVHCAGRQSSGYSVFCVRLPAVFETHAVESPATPATS